MPRCQMDLLTLNRKIDGCDKELRLKSFDTRFASSRLYLPVEAVVEEAVRALKGVSVKTLLISGGPGMGKSLLAGDLARRNLPGSNAALSAEQMGNSTSEEVIFKYVIGHGLQPMKMLRLHLALQTEIPEHFALSPQQEVPSRCTPLALKNAILQTDFICNGTILSILSASAHPLTSRLHFP